MHSTISALSNVPQNITQAIHQASSRTGIDFSYLMNQAKAESSFNPEAKARTSSATGLYQFIESTWLQMVKDHGHKYGLDQQASHIHRDADSGRLTVSSPSTRKAILELRKDPELASAMAAEFAADNKAYLESQVKGRAIGATELYFAHFLGAGGASAFLNQLDEAPHSIAAHHFPKAAQANRNVFYDPATAQPRTMQQVYDFFDRKFGQDFAAPAASAMNEGIAQHNGSKGRIGMPQNGMVAYARSDNGGGAPSPLSFMGLNNSLKTNEHLYLSALMAMPSPIDVDSSNLGAREDKNQSNNDLSLLSQRLKNPAFIQSLL